MSGDFVWRDAGRTVVFRRGGIAPGAAAARRAWLRALRAADHRPRPRRRHRAGGRGERRPRGPRRAGARAGGDPGRDRSTSESLVALGGGRTIDVAKAVASVTGAKVAAIPTTMSGAEMTGIHRLPAGAESRVGSLVRPALVIADPAAMTSQPEPDLRASSMNALAHGADSLYTPFANPVAEMAALRGAELIADRARPGARASATAAQLALGSLLCGYAIDSASFGLHHVVCQTLVRICGGTHAADQRGDPAAGAGPAGRAGAGAAAPTSRRRSRPTPKTSRPGAAARRQPARPRRARGRPRQAGARRSTRCWPGPSSPSSPARRSTRADLAELVERAWSPA